MKQKFETKNGIIYFLKVDFNFDVADIESKLLIIYNRYDLILDISDLIELDQTGFNVIGLTSEITEEHAKLIVEKVNWGNDCYRNYAVDVQFIGIKALDSLKSIMRKLKIFETHNCTNPNEIISDFYVDDVFQQDAYENYLNSFNYAQERTGKWLVLFKKNIELSN